ncbi:hypothetical protein QOT17_006127 [Balamuthia mandrillaris]
MNVHQPAAGGGGGGGGGGWISRKKKRANPCDTVSKGQASTTSPAVVNTPVATNSPFGNGALATGLATISGTPGTPMAAMPQPNAVIERSEPMEEVVVAPATPPQIRPRASIKLSPCSSPELVMIPSSQEEEVDSAPSFPLRQASSFASQPIIYSLSSESNSLKEEDSDDIVVGTEEQDEVEDDVEDFSEEECMPVPPKAQPQLLPVKQQKGSISAPSPASHRFHMATATKQLASSHVLPSFSNCHSKRVKAEPLDNDYDVDGNAGALFVNVPIGCSHSGRKEVPQTDLEDDLLPTPMFFTPLGHMDNTTEPAENNHEEEEEEDADTCYSVNVEGNRSPVGPSNDADEDIEVDPSTVNDPQPNEQQETHLEDNADEIEMYSEEQEEEEPADLSHLHRFKPYGKASKLEPCASAMTPLGPRVRVKEEEVEELSEESPAFLAPSRSPHTFSRVSPFRVKGASVQDQDAAVSGATERFLNTLKTPTKDTQSIESDSTSPHRSHYLRNGYATKLQNLLHRKSYEGSKISSAASPAFVLTETNPACTPNGLETSSPLYVQILSLINYPADSLSLASCLTLSPSDQALRYLVLVIPDSVKQSLQLTRGMFVELYPPWRQLQVVTTHRNQLEHSLVLFAEQCELAKPTSDTSQHNCSAIHAEACAQRTQTILPFTLGDLQGSHVASDKNETC